MSQKPSIPKGTRDFSPQEMVRRNYIFDTIKKVFQRYGYLPIETPAMENLSTLMGKYGEEGDKLIFKILNSGDYLKDSPVEDYINKFGLDANSFEEYFAEKRKANETVPLSFIIDAKKLASEISEKALKYDLTVPFARYVVQHQHEITFPFKRYQIQPVWRADRPQKGRYREFYQCDADVIGSNSLINEVELTQMIDDVFTTLKVPVLIKINNRKILSGIAEVIGAGDRMIDIAIAIDKYDKIGEDGVNKELQEKGFNDEQIKKLTDIFLMHTGRINYGLTADKGDLNLSRLNFLKNGSDYRTSEIFQKGIEEMEYVFNTINKLNLNTAKVEFDITLARGLNYYTGAIFEVKANVGTLTSSICGGGRYDDLTGIFGLPNMSGVGISFGADRIYDVLNELNLYPDTVSASTKLLFVAFNEKDQNDLLPLLAKVRKVGINSEIYPNAKADAKKQFTYGESKSIPFVVSVKEGVLTLKNIVTGEKEEMSIENIINKLK